MAGTLNSENFVKKQKNLIRSFSFCSKRQDEVQKLIADGPSVFICNGCMNLCYNFISGDMSDSVLGEECLEGLNPKKYRLKRF